MTPMKLKTHPPFLILLNQTGSHYSEETTQRDASLPLIPQVVKQGIVSPSPKT